MQKFPVTNLVRSSFTIAIFAATAITGLSANDNIFTHVIVGVTSLCHT